MLQERPRFAYSSAGAAGVLSHASLAEAAPEQATPEKIATEQTVEANITFVVPKDAKPVVFMPTEDGTDPIRTANYRDHRVKIRDARPQAGSLSLDREGFELVEHDTKVRDFWDEQEVKEVYFPEMERLVKEATGASKVVVFDYAIRVDGRKDGAGSTNRAPVRRAHNDYTATSIPRRVRDLLGDEAEVLLEHRVAEVNVWRPIKGPVETAPLAFADASSVASEDLIATDLVYPERRGEIYEVAHNPEQRWFYIPRMAREEAVLIKGYDSLEDGTARFAPHTAFDDPTTRPDAPPRESIEIRTLVFFAPEAGDGT